MLPRVLATPVCAAFVTMAGIAQAGHAALPDTLIALDAPEGQKLLLESTARADYFRLAEHYVTQETGSLCGAASIVMALNAIDVRAPEMPRIGARMFTQENMFNDCARGVLPRERVERGGMTISQLADLVQCQPARAEVVHASDTTLDAFRARAAKNLADPRDAMIVNYNRSEVGQEYMGHLSPIAAYHAGADRLLLMDVARYKYPPVWVKTDALFAAMNTGDPSSGKSRGFVVVSAADGSPGPRRAEKARNPLHILFAMVGGAFVLGIGTGAGIATWRARRKAKRAAAS